MSLSLFFFLNSFKDPTTIEYSAVCNTFQFIQCCASKRDLLVIWLSHFTLLQVVLGIFWITMLKLRSQFKQQRMFLFCLLFPIFSTTGWCINVWTNYSSILPESQCVLKKEIHLFALCLGLTLGWTAPKSLDAENLPASIMQAFEAKGSLTLKYG